MGIPSEETPKVVHFSASDWQAYSEAAHTAVFGTIKPSSFDRIDYALLVVQEDRPVAYVTVRELDHESVYWQYGGGFPWAWKSILTTTSIELLLDWQAKRGKRVVMRVENTNIPMLRMGLTQGFLINGIRQAKNSLLVEMVKEFDSGDEQKLSEHAKPGSGDEEALAGV